MTDKENDIISDKSAKELIDYLIDIAEIRGDMACIFLNDKYKIVLEKTDL